jgi:protein-disulfide isomerase
MSLHSLLKLCAIGLAFSIIGQVCVAQEVFTPAQKSAIESILHDYYLNHPDAFIEAIRKAQSTIRAGGDPSARATVEQKHNELMSDARDPVAGNPEGDVTVVEFFDYRCPYCKRSQPDITALLSADPHVRIVYKDLPVLGQDSVFAARAALAAARQGGYQRLHDAMLEAPGKLTNEAVITLAEAQGLNKDRLLQDMASPEIAANLARNAELAHALGINGTPSFVVGTLLVPGAIEPSGLRKLVTAQRDSQSNKISNPSN